MSAHNKLSLIGLRFDRLTVIQDAGVVAYPSGDTKSQWLCKCECGSEVVVLGSSLTSGNTSSCGCIARELVRARNTTHGQCGSRAYRIWRSMLSRCENINTQNFPNYGGRGISVCKRWHSFEQFILDMGPPPDGASIDRIDNSKNYEPENCRWADRKTQNRNKRNNRIITFNGVSMCLKDWAAKIGIDQASLAERLRKWPLDRALTTPKSGN